MIEIPVIETERLRLRRHEAADLDASFAMWSHPDVYRFIGGRASGRDEAWARLLRYLGQWELLGFSYWLVEDRESGQFVGEVGFLDAKRDLTPPFGDTPEMGWALAPHAHGQGYAAEAVRAGLAWADQRWPRTVCMIDPQNTPSLILAGKLGYREYARTIFKDTPVTLFERLR
jgi:RimJ/RimL family protein N-acetyltransferase